MPKKLPGVTAMTIRVPYALHDRLRQQAQIDLRSMSAEILALLDQALPHFKPPVPQLEVTVEPKTKPPLRIPSMEDVKEALRDVKPVKLPVDKSSGELSKETREAARESIHDAFTAEFDGDTNDFDQDIEDELAEYERENG